MFLVTGSTGTIGSRVLRQLGEAGEKVRAVTRDPARAALPADVDVVACDLDVPATLPDALRGVDSVFLMALGHYKATHDANLIAAARDAGVRHIVQLSTLGVEEVSEHNPLSRWHREAEETLQASGIDWTILRPGGFMSMALAWKESIRTEGVARGPVGDMPEAVTHPDDIAEVAVRALTSSGMEGEIVTMTGPEALTTAQQVDILGSLLGRTLRWETTSLDVHRKKMLTRYLPETVDGVVASLADVLENGDDTRSQVFHGIPRVLGRSARAFRQWAEENVHEFR